MSDRSRIIEASSEILQAGTCAIRDWKQGMTDLLGRELYTHFELYDLDFHKIRSLATAAEKRVARVLERLQFSDYAIFGGVYGAADLYRALGVYDALPPRSVVWFRDDFDKGYALDLLIGETSAYLLTEFGQREYEVLSLR